MCLWANREKRKSGKRPANDRQTAGSHGRWCGSLSGHESRRRAKQCKRGTAASTDKKGWEKTGWSRTPDCKPCCNFYEQIKAALFFGFAFSANDSQDVPLGRDEFLSGRAKTLCHSTLYTSKISPKLEMVVTTASRTRSCSVIGTYEASQEYAERLMPVRSGTTNMMPTAARRCLVLSVPTAPGGHDCIGIETRCSHWRHQYQRSIAPASVLACWRSL